MYRSHLRALGVLTVCMLLLTALAGCGGQAGRPSAPAAGPSSAPSGGAQAPAAGSEGPIFIALAGPMTGDGAEYGKALENGIRLALEQFNSKGGYKGRKVELEVGDDKNDPSEAAKVATKLASDPKIVAVIGHWASSTTFAGIPIYNRNELPMITPTASHPDITKPENKWIFRSSTTQELEGKNLANLAVNKLGKKRIAILYLNTDWGKANGGFFKKFAEEAGAQVVAYDSYPPGQGVDFTAALTKVKGLNPDLVYLGSLYAEGQRIIKQAKELGINATFMGSATFYSEGFLQNGGATVNGVYLDALFVPTHKDEKVQQFVKDFQAKYNKTAGYFDALGYDAALIVLKALEVGGPTRKGIRDAMEQKVNGLRVVTGVVQFDANRSDVNKPWINLVVENGNFKVLD